MIKQNSIPFPVPSDALTRRFFALASGVCALIAVLLAPPVLGPLAAPDGAIEDRGKLVLLWCFVLVAASAASMCFWLAMSTHPKPSAIRRRIRPYIERVWRLRYWAILLAGVCSLIGLGGYHLYAWRANRVDLIERLEPSHAMAQHFLSIAESQGQEAALDALADECRLRRPTVRLTPCQLWNTEPQVSRCRRDAFVAGDLGTACGLPMETHWRPGDPIPWGTRSETARPFSLQRQTFLFDSLRETGSEVDEAVLDDSAAFVDQWRRENLVWPNSHHYAWNDDVTSNRIQAHMFLMDRRRARGLTSKAEELAFLKSLIQHADQLMKPELYNSRTNHGMMQNAALLSIAVGYPEFDKDGMWRKTAISRTEQYVREAVTADGVLRELTPEYHWFGTAQLLWYAAMCHREGLPLDSRVEESLRRMLRFCRELLQPDRSLPMIADSHGLRRSLANWPLDELPPWPEIEELRTATMDTTRMPNEPGAGLWGDSNYFILRAGAPAWTFESALMLVFKTGSLSRAHFHPDALSVALYANGRPLLSGPGYPDYEPTTHREEVIATYHQNAASVDGRSQEWKTAPDVPVCEIRRRTAPPPAEPELVVVQARAEAYRGVSHRRTIAYGPSRTAVLIVDEMNSSDEHDYRQHFGIGPGCIGQPESRRIRVVAESGGRLLLSIETRAIRAATVDVPAPELRERVVSYPGRGTHVTFVTILDCGGSAATPEIDLQRSTLKWTGTEGTLKIRLPARSRTDFDWSQGQTWGSREGSVGGAVDAR